MLSPGIRHKEVPKDLRGNLEFRRFVLQQADERAEYRKALIAACKDDILFYINTFVWQYNPQRREREVEPFISWPFQEPIFTSRDPKKPGILWCIDNDEDLVVEKSRNMGLSWICLLAFEWLWHFHDYKKLLIISRNKEAVDKSGEPDSLFWKIDHIHKYQPKWLMPAGWDENKHRLDMRFENPQTHSVISGQATTGKAGVGGRATAIFVDEFSQIDEDAEIYHRTADTSNCRIFIGTHVGVGTQFFRLTQRVGHKKTVCHWSEHPQKGAGLYHYDPEKAKIIPHDPQYAYAPDFSFATDGKPAGGPYPGVRSPWYDKERIDRDSEREVAMDLDIDPRGSVSQFFDAITIQNLKRSVCSEPLWVGEMNYDSETAQPRGLVPVESGHLKVWINPTPKMGFPAGRYAAGADISWGVGATPSCFSVVNADTGIKILEYTHAAMKPEAFAVACVALCRALKTEDGMGCLFGWEAAGPGIIFGTAVLDLGYRRVYYRTDDFDTEAEVSTKPGWYPAPAHKMSILSDYRAALFSRRMENRSSQALDETLLFKYGDRGKIVHTEEDVRGGDPTEASVNHADRVIADALAWKMACELGGTPRPTEKPKANPVGSMAWRREVIAKQEKKALAWI